MIRDHVYAHIFEQGTHAEVWSFVWDFTVETFPTDVVNYVNDRTFIIGISQFPANHSAITREVRKNLGEYGYD